MSTPAEDFLAHHGVKGMKWGKHKAKVPGAKSREELKALDKAAREKHRNKVYTIRPEDNSDNAILKARRQLDTHAQKYDKARSDYKTQKHQIGKVAAKQVVRDAQNQYYKTLNKASLQTGKEKHDQAMQDIGGVLANAIFDGIAARHI